MLRAVIAASIAVIGALGAIAVSPPAVAQTCAPTWQPTVGAGVGVVSDIFAMTVFDDGTGPAVYAGGYLAAPGSLPANRIAKWDGQSWSPLGNGVARTDMNGADNALVESLTLFDDGSGPALYVGGGFDTAGGAVASNIAKWDGQSWSPLASGMDSEVLSLVVFDDGSGPALYAGGNFTTAGGVTVNAIAKWDGAAWSPLGTGLASSDSLLTVYALSVFDDGTGPALYAGGHFTAASGVAASSLAKWDGQSWSPLGSGINGHVLAQAVFDDGSGPALYVGGAILMAGGSPASNIAKWDGQSWSSLGSGANQYVRSMTLLDDGTGQKLVVGGNFDTIGGVAATTVASWDGLTWAPLGSGVDATFFGIRALTVLNNSAAGAKLFAGGEFKTAGSVIANNIVQWDGLAWSPLGSGLDSDVSALSVFDDGAGPALYVGGSFVVDGAVNLNHIAKWDGQSLLPMGNGLGSSTSSNVADLAVFDDGAGPTLYAAGNLGFHAAGGVASGIARWDGQSWMNSNVGGGLNGEARALTVFDDGAGSGPALHVGGAFSRAGGPSGVAANRIAKWDGATWSLVGTGVSGTNAVVNSMKIFDDGSGSGPALYVGGVFTTAGGVPANGIARWDGQTWSPLGSGIGDVLNFFDRVLALAVFDDGTGPALYASGEFILAGGVAVNNIARWDGLSWSPVGSGLNDFVASLTVFDDGSGPALYAGGAFTTAGGVAANGLARWDGQSWLPLGSGMQVGSVSSVDALAVFDNGAGAALFAGGSFNVSLSGDSYLAKYQGCAVTANPADFNGDGAVDAADLATLLAQWGPCPPPPSVCAADINGDGVVDAADLATLLANWG